MTWYFWVQDREGEWEVDDITAPSLEVAKARMRDRLLGTGCSLGPWMGR